MRSGIHRWVTIGIIALFCIVSGALFRDFVLHGHPPFPGNYMQAWYEPWRSLHFTDGVITLAHKPVAEDVFRHVLPFRLLGIDLFRQGIPPLWNPYNGSGQPLLATLNSGFLDPFNLLFAVFSAGFALGAYAMIQFVLIAWATYIYVRMLKLRRVSALLAAMFFALSGFVMIRLIFISYGLAIATLPFLLYLVERARSSRSIGPLFAVPFVLALALVSTQPQMVLYIGALLVPYGAIRLWSGFPKRQRIRVLLWFILLVMCAPALAAVQLLPTYELMKFSHVRPEDSYGVILKFLMPVEHLFSVVIPNYFGNTATYNYWGKGDSVQTAASLGMFPVFLAFLSVFLRKNRVGSVVAFFAITAVASILLAIDWQGSRMLYALPIPLVSTGAPARAFFVTTFALSVLAGIGFDAVWTKRASKIRIALTFLLFSAAMGALVWLTYRAYTASVACPLFTPHNCRLTAWRNTVFASGLFAVQAASLLVIMIIKATRRTFRRLFSGVIIATIIGAGVYNGWKTLPTSPTAEVFPDQPVISALRKYTGDSRVFGLGEAELTADLATQFRIYDPQFYHPLYIYRYREFIEYANNGRYIAKYPRGDARIKDYLRVDPELIARRDRMLNLDSVRYRLFKKSELGADTPGGELAWEDPTWLLLASSSALPRAYLAGDVRVESSPAGILAALYDPDFDHRNSVVLEKPVPESTDAGRIVGNVDVMTYGADRVEMNVRASRQAILVLTDSYYPGWFAFVDGEPSPVYRANYVFRAVLVPAGVHHIVFRYRPGSFRTGIVISCVALVMVVGGYAVYRGSGGKKRKKK